MKVVVGVLIKNENKILMVQEAFEKCRGMWNFPAGHLDENENLLDAAIREAKEETGFDVKLTGIIDVNNLVCNDRHVVIFNFAAEIVGGEKSFDPEEIMNVEWVDIETLLSMSESQLRSAEVRQSTIKKLLDGKVLPLELISNFDYRN